MNMQVLDAGRDASGGYKVDVTRGDRVGRVSSEWFSRPDDERFLSLGELAAMVRGRADHSRSRLVETSRIHVFLLLVDDLNPIEAGRLPDGSPDLYFRGFYCWNSEVGAKRLGIASFYLRAVCQNRNLWGVADFQEITIRHSKYAASRFAHEAAPALTRFANSSPMPFVNGIKAAREKIVARTDEDRSDFLRNRGFSRAETAKIIDTVLAEEGRKPESIFDFVQGITAVARDKPHQDARLDLEGRAKKLLERAA
ncbi:hypothetical protein [Azorhizobium doebereinerae]|uniref:hypothetical protein n=1 Tax=Azorhizobium doebereinerae TaxID=281091 RepID=UPI0004098684|nr:hypothetical protein [Azorhizobium doebereinerae]